MTVETQNYARTAVRDAASAAAPETGARRVAGPPSPEARAAAALADRRAGYEAAAAPVEAADAAPAEPASGAGPARRRDARPTRTDGTLVPVPRAVQDVLLLLGRLVVGVVLIAHGLQKLTQGVPGTAEGFAQMGIPVPEIAAVFAMAAEIGGGALLILGLLTPLAALLPVVVMAGAAVVHAGSGLFVSEGGWEFAATLGAAALVLGAVGPGRLSADGVIARMRRAR
jgi:putative oxidoreductase